MLAARTLAAKNRRLAIVLGLIAAAFYAGSASAQTRMPFDVGGSFTLKDQFGQVRTERDPNGRAQLLFFGYANCRSICSAVLPLMAEVVDKQEG